MFTPTPTGTAAPTATPTASPSPTVSFVVAYTGDSAVAAPLLASAVTAFISPATAAITVIPVPSLRRRLLEVGTLAATAVFDADSGGLAAAEFLAASLTVDGGVAVLTAAPVPKDGGTTLLSVTAVTTAGLEGTPTPNPTETTGAGTPVPTGAAVPEQTGAPARTRPIVFFNVSFTGDATTAAALLNTSTTAYVWPDAVNMTIVALPPVAGGGGTLAAKAVFGSTPAGVEAATRLAEGVAADGGAAVLAAGLGPSRDGATLLAVTSVRTVGLPSSPPPTVSFLASYSGDPTAAAAALEAAVAAFIFPDTATISVYPVAADAGRRRLAASGGTLGATAVFNAAPSGAAAATQGSQFCRLPM